MAPQAGREIPDIEESLLRTGHRYSFIQALRLLRYFLSVTRSRPQDEEDFARAVRVRPELSLNFPDTDVTSIAKIPGEDPHYLITAAFLGLYGVSSPLPTFYTEDLMDEASEDMTVMRDFLDIVNAPFYPLFFRCWSKYRQAVKVVEEDDSSYLERLFCLLGTGTEKLRSGIPYTHALLRYIGLFTQCPRSALSLKTLLSDALNIRSLDIIQCVPRLAVIPEDQRCVLGASSVCLGVDTYLGSEMEDRMGAFRVRIGPVEAGIFRRFFPDTPDFLVLRGLTHLYLDQPLEWDLDVALKAGEVRTACLGGPDWCRLGWETWVFSGETLDGEAEVRFQPQPSGVGGQRTEDRGHRTEYGM
ncbi:MAG: type VI secretion system baseplate subunit TssG [Deltaproteobacteria bacterium]|nr:type VI secretion system baseplate subunit TssG [Deltaproteobacteria bacterium]